MSENTSNVDFSAFGSDLDEIFEAPVWTDPEPVELVIKSARAGEKNGRPWLMVNFEIVDETGYDEITEFLSLPQPDATPRQIRANRAQRASFALATGFDWSTFTGDTTELVGLRCWAELKVIPNKREGGSQNAIKKYITPAA